MKRLSLTYGIVVAVILTALTPPLFSLLKALVGAKGGVTSLIIFQTCLYFLLLSFAVKTRAMLRIIIVFALFELSMLFLPFTFLPTLVASIAILTAFRVALSYSGTVQATGQIILSAVALSFAAFLALNTGSFLLATWVFFLVLAAFPLFQGSRPRAQREILPRFESAFRLGERSIAQLAKRKEVA